MLYANIILEDWEKYTVVACAPLSRLIDTRIRLGVHVPTSAISLKFRPLFCAGIQQVPFDYRRIFNAKKPFIRITTRRILRFNYAFLATNLSCMLPQPPTTPLPYNVHKCIIPAYIPAALFPFLFFRNTRRFIFSAHLLDFRLILLLRTGFKRISMYFRIAQVRAPCIMGR